MLLAIAFSLKSSLVLRGLEVRAAQEQLAHLLGRQAPLELAAELPELLQVLQVQEATHLEEPGELVPQRLLAHAGEEAADGAHVALELQRAEEAEALRQRRLSKIRQRRVFNSLKLLYTSLYIFISLFISYIVIKS